MHIFHLLSNFRWTERAEPALNLVLGQNRVPGVQATLVCGRNRPGADLIDAVVHQAPRLGVEPLVLNFNKHFRLIPALRDIRSLRAEHARHPVDVFHAHLPNALLMGSAAAHGCVPRPLVITTIYEPEGPDTTLRMRLCARHVDGWVVMSEAAADSLRARHGVPSEAIRIIIPPVDTARFAKTADIEGKALFGLDPDDVVIGMVARYSDTRKSEWVVEALSRIAQDCPRLRVFFIGRGNVRDYVLEPARTHRVSDRISLGGYCRYERLVEAYAAMDALVYPAPGTDKSARAVREAMAAGVPVVAARTGMLPHLIDEGETGLLADPNPRSLADAMKRIYDDAGARRAMGRNARRVAQARFSIDTQSTETLAFYRACMEAREARSPIRRVGVS